MNNREIVFRVDGSIHQGTGHLMRCLAIAGGLKARENIDAVFFSHHSPLQVSISSAFPHRTYYQRGYSGELTIAEKIETYLKKGSVIGLLVDLPQDLGRKEAKRILNLNLPAIALDNHGAARDLFPATINSIAHPDQDNSGNQVQGLYQGPEYIILPPGEKAEQENCWRPDSKRMLIAMGGSDPHNITLKALKAISSLKTDIEIHLLLGPGYSYLNTIEDARKKIHQPLALHRNIPQKEFSSFLAGFKFAVMSFGLTVYSAALAGLPIICLAHNLPGEEAAATFFARYKTGISLGEYSYISQEVLAGEIEKFAKNEKDLISFSQSGKRAVDGQGLERVLDIIIKTCS